MLLRLILFITLPLLNSIRLADLGYHDLRYMIQGMVNTCTWVRNIVPMHAL